MFDHIYSAAATDTPPTDSSSGDLPILLPPAPDTPLSSPMPKRNKGEPSLSELQKNIITALTLKINQRADSLEQMIIANSNTIEDLKTSLNHVYVEIQDLKNDKTKLAEKFTPQQKALVNMEERIANAERYKRRWCLRLYMVFLNNQTKTWSQKFLKFATPLLQSLARKDLMSLTLLTDSASRSRAEFVPSLFCSRCDPCEMPSGGMLKAASSRNNASFASWRIWPKKKRTNDHFCGHM